MLGIGYWVLGVGYWVFGIWYWVLGVGSREFLNYPVFRLGAREEGSKTGL